MQQTIQRTLKEWRTHKELSQMDMADKIGISPSTYNIWENNPEEIRPKIAMQIAGALEVSIDEIIFFNKKSNFKYVLTIT